MRSSKLQTTVTGFTSWALIRLAERKGKTQAEIASYVIELWIDQNDAYLRSHGITYEQFDLDNSGGKVVRLERSEDA